jgi:hypothetical protein
MTRKIVQQPKKNATPPASVTPVSDEYGRRLEQLHTHLDFCRALVDILCFEKKSEATEESFSTIKFKLWELVGEAASEVEQLNMDLRCVVFEANAVQP